MTFTSIYWLWLWLCCFNTRKNCQD